MKTLELLNAMGDLLHFSFKTGTGAGPVIAKKPSNPGINANTRGKESVGISLVFTDPTWFLCNISHVFNPSLVKSGALLPHHM